MKFFRNISHIFDILVLAVGYFFIARVYLAYFDIIDFGSGFDFGDLGLPILCGFVVPLHLLVKSAVTKDKTDKIMFYLSLPLLFSMFLFFGILALMIFAFSSI